MIRLLYRYALWTYQLFIRVAALFNPKAKQWVDGRRNLFQHMQEHVENTSHVWFHFASLGEFEQGRPVLERYKEQWPDDPIIVTFFSPSGYTHRKDYAGARHVFYLPIDSPGNAQTLLDIFQPKAVFFTKYDYWYYYFRECFRREIPLYMVSCVFQKRQIFFKWYGGFFRKILGFVSHFFVQNQASIEALSGLGIHQASFSGDTRFDRVVQLRSQRRELPLVESWLGATEPVLVAGSTWPEDTEKLRSLRMHFPEFRIIIAPHEITPNRIRETQAQFPQSVLYSQLEHEGRVEASEKVLIIDNIGMLSALYAYANIAYVGGGFGEGIHNTLEAATYGVPVIFGPNYQKFEEAKDLIDRSAGFSIKDAHGLIEIVQSLMDTPERLEAGRRAASYVELQAGASQKIIDFLIQKT